VWAQSSLTKQSSQNTIQEAQQRLQVLGYQPGSADGVMGAKTVLAVKKYQADHQLSVTGAIDEKTAASLFSAKPADKSDSTGPATAAAQSKDAASGPSKEEADWAVAIQEGTSDAYIEFHRNHPNSARLTVRTGQVKWGEGQRTGMHRDFDAPYGYILDSVTIGSSSLSISIPEAIILGLAKNSGGRLTLNTSGSFLIPDAVVLFRDDKIVAYESAGSTGGTSPDAAGIPDVNEFDKAVRQGDLTKVRALLASNPALVVSKDSAGSTPLHLAAATSHKEIAELLIANKADVNAKANDGTTPLHQAAFDGSTDVARLLLANGAEINARENTGYTSLHAAAVMGHEEVAELLLANKADINAKGNDGGTPLHLALGRGHTDVADMLRQHGGRE
jgi:hypothetical protein